MMGSPTNSGTGAPLEIRDEALARVQCAGPSHPHAFGDWSPMQRTSIFAVLSTHGFTAVNMYSGDGSTVGSWRMTVMIVDSRHYFHPHHYTFHRFRVRLLKISSDSPSPREAILFCFPSHRHFGNRLEDLEWKFHHEDFPPGSGHHASDLSRDERVYWFSGLPGLITEHIL